MTARRRSPKHALPWKSDFPGPTRSTSPCGRGAGAPIESPGWGYGAREARSRLIAVRGRPTAGWCGSSCRHAPTGSWLIAVSLAQRAVGQGPQRQQLPGRRPGQRDHRPLAAEEPDPQEQPRHADGHDRRGGHRDGQQHRQPGAVVSRSGRHRPDPGRPRWPRSAAWTWCRRPAESVALSPAECRLSEMPVAPPSTWRPTLEIVAIAVCTPMPTNTHSAIHIRRRRSLSNCASRRPGVVA